jgi:hypothetical protein
MGFCLTKRLSDIAVPGTRRYRSAAVTLAAAQQPSIGNVDALVLAEAGLHEEF